MNKIDRLEDVNETKQDLLDQIEKYFPLTFGDQKSLVHCISAKNEYKNIVEENLTPSQEYNELLQCLKNFLLIERFKSKISPYKDCLNRNLEKLLNLFTSKKNEIEQIIDDKKRESDTTIANYNSILTNNDEEMEKLEKEYKHECDNNAKEFEEEKKRHNDIMNNKISEINCIEKKIKNEEKSNDEEKNYEKNEKEQNIKIEEDNINEKRNELEKLKNKHNETMKAEERSIECIKKIIKKLDEEEIKAIIDKKYNFIKNRIDEIIIGSSKFIMLFFKTVMNDLDKICNTVSTLIKNKLSIYVEDKFLEDLEKQNIPYENYTYKGYSEKIKKCFNKSIKKQINSDTYMEEIQTQIREWLFNKIQETIEKDESFKSLIDKLQLQSLNYENDESIPIEMNYIKNILITIKYFVINMFNRMYFLIFIYFIIVFFFFYKMNKF